ncbi:MAG: WD40/YVTN/BNR-like repeat-containing protein [Ignavibacteria bacterium]
MLALFFLCCLFISRAFCQWESLNGGLDRVNIDAFDVRFGKAVIALSQNGIYMSQFANQFWNKIGNNIPVSKLTAVLVDDYNIFVATPSDVYKINSSGTGSEVVFSSDKSEITALASDDRNLYVGTEKGLYVFTKFGTTSIGKNTPVLNGKVNFIRIYNRAIFVATSYGLFVSESYGFYWTDLKTGYLYSDVKSVTVADKIIYAATDYGVIRSMNAGASWELVNFGLAAGKIYAVEIYKNKIYAGTDGMGIYSASVGNENWSSDNFALPFNSRVAFLKADNNNLYAVLQNEGLYVLYSYSNSWNALKTGFSPVPIYKFYYINSNLFAKSPARVYSFNASKKKWDIEEKFYLENLFVYGDMFYVVRDGKVYYSRAMGGFNYYNTEDIKEDIISFATNDSFKFAGTQNGVYTTRSGSNKWSQIKTLREPIYKFIVVNSYVIATAEKALYVSSDFGQNWKQSMLSGMINDVWYNGYGIFVTTSGSLYVSTDLGITWNAPVRYSFVSEDNSLHSNGKYVVAAAGNLMYLSNDSGKTFVTKNADFATNVKLTAIATANDYVYVATFENGVWRRKINELIK